MNLKRHCARWLAAGILLTAPLLALAAYPDQPIKVIVAFPAGSAVDVVARSIVSRLAEPLGQPIVIENRVGAGGNIGFELAARASKDGYTLLFAPTQLAANPGLGKVNYDPLKDFAPVIADEVEGRLVKLGADPNDAGADVPVKLTAVRGPSGRATGFRIAGGSD